MSAAFASRSLQRLTQWTLGVVGLYALAAGVLWGAQRHLIFEPQRTLSIHAEQLPFQVQELRIPVGPAGQSLAAWWIPPRGPDGKLFLYFHGNDGNIADSIGETELIRGLGHGVLMVDYRGYGESDGGFPSEAKMYQDAEAALAFASARLGFASRDIFVYGHSLGSAVAIDLAAKHPELGGLVAESAFTSMRDMANLQARYAMFPVDLFLTQRFESLRKAETLSIPVLYIHGTADEVVPYAMGETLFARSGGRKAFVRVEGGRHDDNRQVAPEQIQAALRQLVDDSNATVIASRR
jgi:uncharacterized protein